MSEAVNQITDRIVKELNLPTPEQISRRHAELEDMDKREHHRMFHDTLAKANLPERQRSQNGKLKRDGKWHETMMMIKGKMPSGSTFALVGVRGAGKTQMAVSIALELAQAYIPSLYCTATEMLMRFKATYKQDAKATEEDIVKAFRKPSLLIIDEMNKRAENEWEQRLVFEVLDKRYQDMKDTIIISNQTPVEFCASMGPSLISRINETGGVIECNWESFR